MNRCTPDAATTMTAADLLSISRYVMPTLPLHPAKLGFLFDWRLKTRLSFPTMARAFEGWCQV